MTIKDIFMLVVTWLHAISAVTWVGGSIFYLLVLRPFSSDYENRDNTAGLNLASTFQNIVNTCIITLIATGVVLATDRLTDDGVGSPYLITLGFKSILSIWMFIQVESQRRQSRALETMQTKDPAKRLNIFTKTIQSLSGYNAIVIVGIIVLFLSDILDLLFEKSLGNG